MEVSRTRRVISFLVNTFTFNFLLIGNIILLITRRTTLGGVVTGYKYDKSGSMIIYGLMVILFDFLYALTFMILWIYDVVTLKIRGKTLPEKFAGVKKVNA